MNGVFRTVKENNKIEGLNSSTNWTLLVIVGMVVLGMFQNEVRNVYSQHGEDGIIEAILNKLRIAEVPLDQWCCEFGAWDGKFLSNTFNLIENHNYKSVLIEADHSKFQALSSNLGNFAGQHLFNEYVDLSSENNLESFLKRAQAPLNFDFLSIDVDGMDYWIFDSLVSFKPKIVCIEYNHSIPFNVTFIQEKSFKVKQGASAKAIVKLGESKGYSLVAITRSNLLFLENNFRFAINFGKGIELEDIAPELTPKSVSVFAGYDGTIIMSEPVELLWHGILVKSESIQFLPKAIRQFPSDFGPLRKVFYRVFQVWLYFKKYGAINTLKRIYRDVRKKGTI